MRASYKCENCLEVTVIRGEGPRFLGCQFCGCFDIKFDSDVTLVPISSINPGDVFPAIEAKKDESFLGSHSFGNTWFLTFALPKVVPPAPSIILRRK